MRQRTVGLLCMLIFLLAAGESAFAGIIRAYVGEFAVTGVSNREELKGTLQTLLASRLKGDIILTVESSAGADVTVSGSYVVFGKVFSIDAVVRDAAGKVITRAFEQGERADDLLPAINKLARSLSVDIVRVVPAHDQALVVTTAPLVAPAQPPVSSEIVRKGEPSAGATSDSTDTRKPTPESEIVRPELTARQSGATWLSQRLDGAMIGISPGRFLERGEREIFIADQHSFRLYRQEGKLKLVSEVTLGKRERILAIDTADLDGDGSPEVYLTCLNGEDVASQVWEFKGNALTQVASNLPYFFRGIVTSGGKTTIYAQQQGPDKGFYGNVGELRKQGKGYELQAQLRMPRFGNVYNFSPVPDKDGKNLLAVINDNGYLIIYAESGEELWRSSDTYGGSETYYQVADLDNMRTTGDPNRWIYLNQRIMVTPEGEIIVPQNSGFFVVGYNRSYSKNSIYSFKWNGSSLEEVWHTKVSQNYLADFFTDNQTKELVILEVVKKEGPLAKGASVVAIKKIQ